MKADIQGWIESYSQRALTIGAAHETDDELRERLRPKGEKPSLLAIVLAQAAIVNDPPTTLRGETVGVAHVRIYAGVDGLGCHTLEGRLRERLPCTWRVDVLPEPEAQNENSPRTG